MNAENYTMGAEARLVAFATQFSEKGKKFASPETNLFIMREIAQQIIPGVEPDQLLAIAQLLSLHGLGGNSSATRGWLVKEHNLWGGPDSQAKRGAGTDAKANSLLEGLQL